MYYKLLVDGKASYTDMLVWAIMVDRHELARQISFHTIVTSLALFYYPYKIWSNTVLPVHTALVASHLYRTLTEWFQGNEVCVHLPCYFLLN